MFNIEPLKNEFVTKVDCAGCHDHVEVSISDGSSRSCVMIQKYMDQFAERVKKMKVYDDDVWVVTFPKCGTTWTQEMVWMVNNDLDYEKALKVNLNDRFPFLELNGVLNKFDGDSVGVCENLTRPRHIKSHLPVFLLPDELWTVKPKLIYVARNPKDVAVSFFHHYRHIVGYEGTQEDFNEAFLKDQIIYAPFNDHVIDFWNLRDEPNILFLNYEDMKTDMNQMVKKAMRFLGKKYSQEQIEKLCKHLSVDSMRANPACNNDSLVEKAKSLNANGATSGDFRFIRKGEVGSFNEEFSNEMHQRFDSFMQHITLLLNKFSYRN